MSLPIRPLHSRWSSNLESVAWSGYLLGGRTVVHLLKFVFYHEDTTVTPSMNGTPNHKSTTFSLLTPSPQPCQSAQSTSSSPLVFLVPGPCHLRVATSSNKNTASSPNAFAKANQLNENPTWNNTIAIVFSEFLNYWLELQSYTRAIISTIHSLWRPKRSTNASRNLKTQDETGEHRNEEFEM